MAQDHIGIERNTRQPEEQWLLSTFDTIRNISMRPATRRPPSGADLETTPRRVLREELTAASS